MEIVQASILKPSKALYPESPEPFNPKPSALNPKPQTLNPEPKCALSKLGEAREWGHALQLNDGSHEAFLQDHGT